MWETTTTMKMLLCFNFITLAIAIIEEESKTHLSDEDTHHIACVQRWRLETTCTVGPWLECPPDSNKDRIRASTTDASEDLPPREMDPLAPVTTQDPDPHATPSPATGRALYRASKDGDLEKVKRILAAGHVNINTRGGRWTMTPVMVAARMGHRDVVKFLVDRGADMSLVDRVGSNVLHWACYGGNQEIVKLILSLNVVDINARNNDGKTAVKWAKVSGHQHLLDLLVSHGAHRFLGW